jgi:hypothetical protein
MATKKKIVNTLDKIEKSVKSTKPSERTFYNVFSKHRGYLCSCPSEFEANKALHALYRENEQFWRRARSEGKKSRDFDCYAVATTGIKTRLIELQFDAEDDEDEEFEDVVNADAAKGRG